MDKEGKGNTQNRPWGVGERIAKRIAQAGICSRREADRLIEQGSVKLNGVRVETPATLVLPEDVITVKGKKIEGPTPLRVFCFHKPVGLVTTHKDEHDRPTVFEGLPKNLPRLISIGRLDLNSEGLLLLTTSGDLARYMELPVQGFTRTYRVRVHGKLQLGRLERLKNGVTVEGVRYGPIEVHVEKQGVTNAWLIVTLHEGKNREIRNVMTHLGLEVNRLIRVGYGPFDLGDLPKGAMIEIPMTILRKKLKGFFDKEKVPAKKQKVPAPCA